MNEDTSQKNTSRWKNPLFLKTFGIIIILGYFFSGIYSINPEEEGVKLRFGKVVEEPILPGIHYKLPYPLEKIYRIRTRETKRVSIGYQLPDNVLGRLPDVSQTQFFTGDKNLINIQMMVQYSIKDLVKYLFNTANASGLIQQCAETALNTMVSRKQVDDILTIGKVELQLDVQRKTQEHLDLYQTGVQIRSVNIQNVTPPPEVADAFKAVASAREDRNRIINEALGYQNEVLPRARGEAQKNLQAAEAYCQERINTAEGNAARFIKIFQEYEHSRDITSKRLYLEAMEEILPQMKLLIIDSENGENVIDLSIIKSK